jgi:ribonuclease D
MDDPREISREALAALPVQPYQGEVVMVSSAAELEDAAAALLAEPVAIGFDTETRPAFRPGESYLPSLFQAAGAKAVYLFPVQRLDCAAALSALLSRDGLVKAGVSVADDLKKLKQVFPFQEASVVDLGTAAKRRGIRQSGVRNLAGMFLGIRIPKGKSTSNWAAARLSPQQIAYAAMDAWACRALYLKFAELGFF